MFVITDLDMDNNVVSVLDTADNVKETASISDFVSYLNSGVEFKGVSVVKCKDTTWNISVPIENAETSEVDTYLIAFNINQNECLGIEKLSPVPEEEKEFLTEISNDSSEEDDIPEGDISEGSTPEDSIPDIEESCLAAEFATSDIDVSVDTNDACDTAHESEDISVHDNVDSSEFKSISGEVSELEAKMESKPVEDVSTASESDKSDSPKKSGKRATKKAASKSKKTAKSEPVTILSFVEKLKSCLDINVINAEAFDAKNADDYLVIDSTCSDFVFFKGDKITISINGDLANNYEIKDAVLKHLSEIPFRNQNNEVVNLLDACYGVSDKISVFPPFSSELGVSDSDNMLNLVINGLSQ